jgi:putative component of membrane protein insertase Oxa1/YidC/SpoIIIJ protein YidD
LAWTLAGLVVLAPVGAEPAEGASAAADAALVLAGWSRNAEGGSGGARALPALDATPTNEVKLLANLLLFFYQALISPQDRPSCIFTPTCSEYARLAIRRHGLLGLIMASDRLQRCNRFDRDVYPVDRATGRYVDPVP